jgi:6-pyruvoyltetrahydropterin/6-carboxytetrahydropterin synthase
MAFEFTDTQTDRPAVKVGPFSSLTFELTRSVGFEAAHFMPGAEAGHDYRRVHGHSFQLEAAVQGTARAARDWVVDLAALGVALKEVADSLDHGLLNEIPGLEVPTLERLCAYAAERLLPTFPGLTRVTVSRPSLRESCTLRVG